MNYFTALFALIIGIACFWMSFKLIKLYLKVKKWNRVKATVISKEVIRHVKYSSTRTPYGLRAEYTYQINNTNYKGHNIYLAELAGGQVNLLEADAEKRLNKIESEMVVFVNPNDPDQSVMYCEGVGLYVLLFSIGLLSILIGLGSLLG